MCRLGGLQLFVKLVIMLDKFLKIKQNLQKYLNNKPKYGFEQRTSGDIYAGDPLWSWSLCVSDTRCCPKQKFVTTISWVVLRKTRLASFKSRWTTFCCWDDKTNIETIKCNLTIVPNCH